MNEVIKAITENAYSKELLPLKILSVLASICFAGIIIYARMATNWAQVGFRKQWTEFWSAEPYQKTLFLKKWAQIKKRLEKGWESEGKLAIIEADELLNRVLEALAYNGETVGERLKNIDKETLPNLDDVWRAHKLRNDIVHDLDYRLNLRMAHWSIGVYEKAFEHLNVF